MNLTSLTTALHKWADAHGGQFPDAMLCEDTQLSAWVQEALTRFGLSLFADGATIPHFKGVRIYPFLSEDDPRILFACTPDA